MQSATDTTLKTALINGNGLLNAEQAAQYVSLSTSYIRKACAAKRIPFVRIGTRTLFRRSDLDEWISDHLVKTNDDIVSQAEYLTASARLRPRRTRKRGRR
jgi:excisionase family DNA binding protein